jgi:hypothetical protein
MYDKLKRMDKYKEASTQEIFEEYAKIMDELKVRKVIRTFNNPVADYAEWLVALKLKLKLETNSKAGYDGTDSKNIRYQIKCRRLQVGKSSRQLGVIRKLEEKEFEFLVGVLFDRSFSIQEAYMIPHEVIEKYAKYSSHQNGHIFYLKGPLLKDPKVKDITEKLKKT